MAKKKIINVEHGTNLRAASDSELLAYLKYQKEIRKNVKAVLPNIGSVSLGNIDKIREDLETLQVSKEVMTLIRNELNYRYKKTHNLLPKKTKAKSKTKPKAKAVKGKAKPKKTK